MNDDSEISFPHIFAQFDNAAKLYLKRHGLLSILEEITRCSNSTGLSSPGYAFLHYFIKTKQPRYLLECGTGISTHLIAATMKTYCYDKYQGQIKLISLENDKKWFDEAMVNYPEAYRDFLEIRLSPVDYHQYAFLRGTIYKDVPMLPYDVVFVDGPYHQGMCNMDFIRLLENSDEDHSMAAIVDGRKATILGYQAILGEAFVKFFRCGMSYIGPVNKGNLISKKNLDQIFKMNVPVFKDIPFIDSDVESDHF